MNNINIRHPATFATWQHKVSATIYKESHGTHFQKGLKSKQFRLSPESPLLPLTPVVIESEQP